MEKLVKPTILLICTLMLIPILDDAEAAGLGRLHRDRLEIGRGMLEVQNVDWTTLLPYYDDDIEYHDPIVDIYGFDTLVPFFARLFSSSPDLVTTVEDETILDGVYMATWTMAGQFNGVPYSAKGMSIVKFRDRSTQAYYSRDYYTEGDIMATIPGLAEAVAGFQIAYRCVVDPTFDCPLPPPAKLATDGTGATKGDALQPVSAFRLQQNVPNPFNPVTKIAFDVPRGGAKVALRIYDISGRLVRTLVDGFEPSGTRTASWYGKDDQGRPVASGAYYYQLTAPSFSERRKMLLLK